MMTAPFRAALYFCAFQQSDIDEAQLLTSGHSAISLRSKRQHKAWGVGVAETPGKHQIGSLSPRSGRQTLAYRLPLSVARIRGLNGFSRVSLGVPRSLALHPGLYAATRIRGLKTQSPIS